MTRDADRKLTTANDRAESFAADFELELDPDLEADLEVDEAVDEEADPAAAADPIETIQRGDFASSAAEETAVSLSFEDLADRNTGFGRIIHRLRDDAAEGLAPTGGDLDVDQYQSKVSGEEAVGGSAPTPDQNVIDDLAESEGIETPDEHPLRTLRMLQGRDAHRWELDPESSEDYPEHSQ